MIGELAARLPTGRVLRDAPPPRVRRDDAAESPGERLGYSGRSYPGRSNTQRRAVVSSYVAGFLLWCILLVLCWPLALLALILYPIVWLLLLPFRLAGIAVDGVLALVRGIILLPGRALRGLR